MGKRTADAMEGGDMSIDKNDARVHWGVEGPSIEGSAEGSVGEECGFGINVREDGTGYIVGWAQYATERMALDLTPRRIRALRDMLMRNTFDVEKGTS